MRAHLRMIRMKIPPIIADDFLPTLVDCILVPMREVSDAPDEVLRRFAESHIVAAARAGQDEVRIKHVARMAS